MKNNNSNNSLINISDTKIKNYESYNISNNSSKIYDINLINQNKSSWLLKNHNPNIKKDILYNTNKKDDDIDMTNNIFENNKTDNLNNSSNNYMNSSSKIYNINNISDMPNNNFNNLSLNLNTISNSNSIIESFRSNPENNYNKPITRIMKRNMEFLKEIKNNKRIFSATKEPKLKKILQQNCRKILENPQKFFTYELTDNMIKALGLDKKYINNDII